MDGLIPVKGIVLSDAAVGEYDKLATILTLEKGKVRVFARGAKRPRNRLSAAMQPFHFGNFYLYEGRNSYTVDNAEILNFFEGIREDLDRSLTGMFLLELADYYGRENDDARALVSLLYQSLRAIENGRPEIKLVRIIYEIRALVIDGQYPGIPGGNWQDSTKYALDFIEKTPVERLYTFEVSESVLEELKTIAGMYRRRFIDRDLKSLELIEV